MNNVKTVLIWAFVFSLSIEIQAQVDSVQILNTTQFLQKVRSTPQPCIVDLRDAKDFEKGHIESAIWSEKSEKLFQIIDSLGKKKTYLLYCKRGKRSVKAAKLVFKKYGIVVYSLKNGLNYRKKFRFRLVKT